MDKDFHPVCQDQLTKTSVTTSRRCLQQDNGAISSLLSSTNKGQGKSFHTGHKMVFQSTLDNEPLHSCLRPYTTPRQVEKALADTWDVFPPTTIATAVSGHPRQLLASHGDCHIRTKICLHLLYWFHRKAAVSRKFGKNTSSSGLYNWSIALANIMNAWSRSKKL